MKEIKIFRLKPSRFGTVEIKLVAEEMVKSFYLPDEDGLKFREVLGKTRRGDELYLCFKKR
jgi:hypothetical protein